MNEEDIRPQKVMTKQKEVYMEDIKNLLKRKNEFIEVNCPACESNDYKKSLVKYDLSYVTCNKCGTMFINPRPTPEILDEYYNTSQNYKYWNEVIFPASENARKTKIFKPRVEKIIEICKKYNVKTEIIVDVGAGFGTFCEEIRERNIFKKIIAVEPTPYLAETCRKKNLEVIEKPIEKIKFNDKVDVVTSFETIEHLFSPKGFILGCKEILSEDGFIIITCPNIDGFDISTLKELSDSIDSEHLNYFNPNSLSRLLTDCGFEVIERLTPGKLDSDLVRKSILKGEFDVSNQPFLKRILVDGWEQYKETFQKFLADNLLSSHLWIVAKNKNDR
jgi:2-polyprenyl-3-methyl-5-hydroxy-6-metoxy-1,4-benzoquinol methylase/ribosomal protein S27E